MDFRAKRILRVVVDTNVLISGLVDHGKPRREFSSSLESERQVGADSVIPGLQTVSTLVAGPRKNAFYGGSHIVYIVYNGYNSGQ